MIDPKELRIGNIINSQGLAMVVSGIYELKILYRQLKPNTTLRHPSDLGANPIPLTSEILKKAGFEDLSTVNIWQDKIRLKGFPFTFVFTKTYNELRLHPENFSDNLNLAFIISGGIKSVHQLQNLYFALTGEELEIKL